jgi:hypothetical protein
MGFSGSRGKTIFLTCFKKCYDTVPLIVVEPHHQFNTKQSDGRMPKGKLSKGKFEIKKLAVYYPVAHSFTISLHFADYLKIDLYIDDQFAGKAKIYF